MKIVVILNHFLPEHIAGTEMYAYFLAKILLKSGFDVSIIIPHYGSVENSTYSYNGIRVLRYGEPSIVDKALQMGQRKPDGLRNFTELLKDEKPHIVHFHELAGSNGISLYHVEEARKAGFRIVMTFHLGRHTASFDNLKFPDDIFDNYRASLNFYRNKGFGNFAARFLYFPAFLFKSLHINTAPLGKLGTALAVPQLVEKKKRDFYRLVKHCHKIVVIARWYEKILLQNGVSTEKLAFIEQGISCPEYIETAEHIEPGGTLRVIFVGRISHFKGIRLLIQAIAEMDHLNILLDIYGDSGEDDSYINECKEKAEHVKNVRFMGRLSSDETLQTMSQYHLLVLPSTFSEMSPLVIREAFAAGIPVLASDSMGAKEQITDDLNGWLFKMNEAQSLKERLQMLIDNPALISEAKKHIPPVRTFDDVTAEYIQLYHEITSAEFPS